MSKPTFPGFSPQALTFFRQLTKHNDRAWFTPRKEWFETHVRGPMIELVSLLSDDLRKFAVDYVPGDPKKVIYRIYRDTRFSKDKTPYKTHIGAHFQHRKLPKNMAGGFYVGVSHAGVEIAGGVYMPGPEQLAAIRALLVQDTKRLEQIAGDKKLLKLLGPLQGAKLTRVPKAFDPDHPAAEFLKMKQFYCYTTLDAEAALTPTLLSEVSRRFERVTPLVEFFNDAILKATVDAGTDERPKRPDAMF